MVMDYINKRIEEASSNSKLDYPEWVSKKNLSFRAWEYVEQLRREKALYIRRHSKVTDFSAKKAYQIKGSEVARGLGISRTSLNNTSSFSPHFKKYLSKVNAELAASKDERLEKAKRINSRGPIKSNKNQIVLANAKLKRRVDELEAQKTEEIVRLAFDQLALPIKRKLGID